MARVGRSQARTAVLLLASCMLLGVASEVMAQETRSNALGFAVGLNDDDVSAETMFLANLRVRAWGRSAESEAREDAVGFLEPEISYWKRNRRDFREGTLAWARPDSDLSVGLNAVLVYQERTVDLSFGVGLNVHRLTNVAKARSDAQSDQTRLGGNVQFGVELPLSDSLGLWGAGRWDLIEGSRTVIDTNQVRIYGGLRLHF